MIGLGQATVSLEFRDVFKDGVALRIGTRAFDILEMLIRHQGQLLSKDQILQRVWPDTVVEENNLQVHISALRKALGSDRDLIRTIPGRGYVLLGGEVGLGDGELPGQLQAQPLAEPRAAQLLFVPGHQHRMPTSVDLVGRQALLEEVDAALDDTHSLITLIGPGGVGKTSLAVALGRRRLAGGSPPICFVPLAHLQCGELLPEALASALGVDCSGTEPLLESVIQHLSHYTGLIILDNCEHLIDPLASLVETLLLGAPAVHILATSREPLRIAGERSFQVPPLAVPEPAASREVILSSDSATVFLRHWKALDSHMANTADIELDDYSVELVGEVCRRLDGIPLALEMGAARVCALGLYQLIASLDDSVHLLAASLRTAPPRQQTLEASLAWSYRLLSSDERAVLGRLADLEGRFTLEQACTALQCPSLARACIMECIVGLATKSLLMVSAQGPFRFYRMLGATRACLRAAHTPCGTNTGGRYLSQAPELPDIQAPLSLRSLQPVKAVPSGPDGYHARHQRALAAGR